MLLYELLTGTTPLSHERLTQAAFTEMLRRDPRGGAAQAEHAAERLEGDAAVDRGAAAHRAGQADEAGARRAGLDRDEGAGEGPRPALRDGQRPGGGLQRHLSHEPVEAGPPSAWYRLRKFGRRNRVALATAAVVATALVAGTAVSTWQAIRATKAEGLAQKPDVG